MRAMRRSGGRRSSIGWLAVLAFVAGCSDGVSNLGKPCPLNCQGDFCTTNRGCGPDELCIGSGSTGYCSTSCESDTECGTAPLRTYVCTKDCAMGATVGDLPHRCATEKDLRAICPRQLSSLESCAKFSRDSVCETLEFFCPDGIDAEDCASTDQATMRCEQLCPGLRATGCPNEFLVRDCGPTCHGTISMAKGPKGENCRPLAYALLECEAINQEVCDAEGLTDPVASPCASERTAFVDCQFP